MIFNNEFYLSNVMPSLNTEIYYLIIVTFFCGLLWIPYVTERFFRIGIKETCGYGDKNINIPQWASRAKLAHLNLIENLPLFAIFAKARLIARRWVSAY